MSARIMPINNCMECPRFNEEPPYYECTLSDTRHYDKEDENWEKWLIQYCPLAYLDDMLDEAFEKGREYEKMKREGINKVIKSIETTKWVTAHDFMEKLEKLRKESG